MGINNHYAAYGEFTFDYEREKGGDPEFPIIIWVRELANPEGIIGSRFFHKDTDEQHIHNFMKKIAYSDEYRKKWHIHISDEQEMMMNKKEEQQRIGKLQRRIQVYEYHLSKNDKLREMFIRELEGDKGLPAPLQVEMKNDILHDLKNNE